MTFQAYLDTIQAKTGKTPDEIRAVAGAKGLTTHGDLVAWAKEDLGLGHGHATAVAMLVLKGGHDFDGGPVDTLLTDSKARWRPLVDAIVIGVGGFGPDVRIAANATYVNLFRGRRRIGLLQPSAGRLDVGIKLPGADTTDRVEAAGAWNDMVTHRIRLAGPDATERDAVEWLRRAYEAAG